MMLLTLWPILYAELTNACLGAASGFDRDDVWGFRALEPSRCCITSIALVLLKTGVTHDGGEDDVGVEGHHEDGEDGHAGMRIDQQQLATAQKLLLFWRKPAVSTITLNSDCHQQVHERSLILGAPGFTAQVLVGWR